MKAGELKPETHTIINRWGWVNFGRRWWVNFQCRLTLKARILLRKHRGVDLVCLDLPFNDHQTADATDNNDLSRLPFLEL
jgi:hypothetical protein